MKLKKVGFASHVIKFGDLNILTDPWADAKPAKQKPDIVLCTECSEDIREQAEQIYPDARVIINPGEYEMRDVIIQRRLRTDYYKVHYKGVNILYAGLLPHATDPEVFSDTGDVDVLILPVGNNEVFPNYEVLSKIVSMVDPQVLIPMAYNDGTVKPSAKYTSVKALDEYMKSAGYPITEPVNTYKYKKVTQEDQKQMEVVILQV